MRRTAKPTVLRSRLLTPTISRSRDACSASSAAARLGHASARRSPPAPPTAWPRVLRSQQWRPRNQRRRRRPHRLLRRAHRKAQAVPRLPQPRAELSPPTPSAISAYFPISRGLPISAGWNSNTAASVVTSDSASSLPMLDVPGWLDSHRLPNAVAVVSALKKIARVREDCSRLVLPERHATM